jgi:hypothetical protein
VHPYVSPEVVSLDLSELRKIVPGKPIWITEFSSSTQDINEQARYTTQMVAEMLSQGVVGMFYYLRRGRRSGGTQDQRHKVPSKRKPKH